MDAGIRPGVVTLRSQMERTHAGTDRLRAEPRGRGVV